MLIKNEQLEIPEDNPFINDKLSRECIANNLEKIIDSISTSMVLSIDSSWGKGKTTFINMWRKRMDQCEKYKTLYFNAWENDDCDDPLLAMISEMESTLLSRTDYDAIAQNLKKYATPLLKSAIPSIIKIITRNVVDINGIKENVNSAEIVDLFGEVGKAGVSLYKEEKQAKQGFKKTLIEYQETEGKKVVFFIDELDRCRPTFAIETLEKIKHLFNIPNYIFILALDKEQLSYSVQTLYGQKMDAKNYLRRFIDLEYTLPEPNIDSYIDYLLGHYNLKNQSTHYFQLSIKALAKNNQVTLREIDKLFNYLSIILPMSELFNDRNYNREYQLLFGVIYSFFPLMKIKSNELFYKFVNGTQILNTEPYEIIINIFSNVRNDTILKEYYSSIIHKIIYLNYHLKRGDQLTGEILTIQGEKLPSIELDLLLDSDYKYIKFINSMMFTEDFIVEN